MDPRVKLLKDFSQGFIPGTVKVETEQFGFPFLKELLSDGVELEYGELTPSRLLHKYKLVNVPEHRMNELLRAHLGKTCNLCRYFGAEANDAFLGWTFWTWKRYDDPAGSLDDSDHRSSHQRFPD